jgi:Mu transposase-like protein
VAAADAVNPRFTAGWLDYAQHCGFATDPARVRSPKDKPKVERAVQYVRGNFFAGEHFTGLPDAQARAEVWCRDMAGLRVHGTIQARPAEVFAEHEAGALLPLCLPYDVPVFAKVKVHRDFHVEIGRALYSAPKEYLGCHLDARADSALVKLFHHGQLVKTHPRQQPGRRVTDPADLPAEKTTYAMRDVTALARAARRHGDAIGVYAERLLDTDLPWTKMRQVYRLLGLVKKWGAGRVDQACRRALDAEAVDVNLVSRMLERGREQTEPDARPDPVVIQGRFARDPSEFATTKEAGR